VQDPRGKGWEVEKDRAEKWDSQSEGKGMSR